MICNPSSEIQIGKLAQEKTKKFPKGNPWARGYFVSTVGINKHALINYIKNQEHRKVDIENLKLF
ncbi:MAG TPA: hypothetical protein DD454_02455 [Candidatus Moranbacteria bacterium]|nr:hypothetical protein [Candidatus Moranbacteria bacterium]